MKEKLSLKVKHYINKQIRNLIPEKILMPNYIRFMKILRINLKKRKLLRFEVHLAEHCNLNCKYCSHFSSLAEKEFLNIETFERDLARISELTGRKIERIILLGGEPLLHPQLMEFLNIPKKYFDIGNIAITTNGILLLKQPDEFWKTCKRNNINIWISYYPIKIDRFAINNMAKSYGVTVRYMGGGVKTMYRAPLDLNGTQNVKDSFLRCFLANDCYFLEKGKMYPCPVVPNSRHFNRYFNQNLQVSANDYIDIYKIQSIDELFNWGNKPVPFCRYCNLRGTIYGLKWDISKKEMSEWV
jgi:MoaA/NifB/PqqE/SkfB family radical SAM enzyme